MPSAIDNPSTHQPRTVYPIARFIHIDNREILAHARLIAAKEGKPVFFVDNIQGAATLACAFPNGDAVVWCQMTDPNFSAAQCAAVTVPCATEYYLTLSTPAERERSRQNLIAEARRILDADRAIG